MERWVEAADWIVWQLCGTYVRNACTAGYKGIRQDGDYPAPTSSPSSRPGFAGFVADKLEHPIGQLGDRAGTLTAEAAAWTGLPEGIAVAVGNVDAHVTAPAAQAVEPGQMVAIMGTSTCHVMSSDVLREVPGMCGVVDGGIVAGSWGYEAGQSGVGDIFGWFVDTSRARGVRREAADARASRCTSCSPSWPPSRRSASTGWSRWTGTAATARCWSTTSCPGWWSGQTLATRPEDTYRALLEATAFGTRMIVETFATAGVPVDEFIVAGGLAKNPLLMQIYADVIRLPLSVIGSDAGPRARLGHPRRGRRRRLPRRPRGRRERWARSARASTQPDESRAAGLRPAVRRVPRAARPLRPRRGRDATAQRSARCRRAATATAADGRPSDREVLA